MTYDDERVEVLCGTGSVAKGPDVPMACVLRAACCVLCGGMVGLGSLLLLSPSGHAEQYAAATEVDRSCDGLAAQAGG